MTPLRFDAKEFVPSTAGKCRHPDAVSNPTTSTSTGMLLSSSYHPHEVDKKNHRSQPDRLNCNQNQRGHCFRNKSEHLVVRTKENDLANRHRRALTNEKLRKNNCKRRNDMSSRMKKQVQPCKLQTGEGKCSASLDTIKVAPQCFHGELFSNPMNCKIAFPELHPSNIIRHGKRKQPNMQPCRPSTIWSNVISKNLIGIEVKDEMSKAIDVSKGIDGIESSITELVPLTQPVNTSRYMRASTGRFHRPPLAMHPTEDCILTCESYPSFGEIQYPAPQMRKALVPFEKLRDRWWNLMLLHEEKQRLSKKEVDLVIETDDVNSLVEDVKFDRNVVCGGNDRDSLRVGILCKKLCDLSLSLSTDRYYDQYALKLPLHDAIYRDDTEALKLLISVADSTLFNSCDDIGQLSPLELAVKLNRPHLVRLLCYATEPKESDTCEGALKRAPLLMATNLGHHECIHAILSVHGGSSLLSTKDAQGNTAIHYACWDGIDCATFQCLLNYITSSCAASLLFKLFSCRNNQEQTPLHVAAQNDRVDIINIVLNHRKTSNLTFLSKLLSIHDAERQTPLLAAISSGSSDVVMSFLMWRGNKCFFKCSATLAVNTCTSIGKLLAYSAFCPLTWAVKYKDIDMVKLLLEFNDPSSGSGFKLSDALYFAVNGYSLNNEHDVDCAMLEILRVLVGAGANPCVFDVHGSQGNVHGSSISSAIALATSQRKLACVAQLLDSYEDYLKRVRHQRRNDPKLQSQPESFFVLIETTENVERNTALRESLLSSLSMACLSLSHNNFPLCMAHIQCCLLLYQKNAKLGSSELQRLKESLFLHSSISKPLIEDPFSLSFRNRRKAEIKQNQCCLSQTMLGLPWFDVRSFSMCSLFSSSSDELNVTAEQKIDVNADVLIVCNDGDLFLAHEMVLGRSHKFAAAIRFAKLSKDQSHITDDFDPVVKVNIDLSSNMCRRLLEHLYHGSLGTFVSVGRSECCKELLELMLVGDEYICTSLVHECIQRLLASIDDYDRCFCSFCWAECSANRCSSVGADLSLGQSYLVSAETVLDVLAALELISCLSKDDDCSLNKVGRNLVCALREMAFCIALCEFGFIVQSEAFDAEFNLETNETSSQPKSSAPEMFLFMLLQDLVALLQECS